MKNKINTIINKNLNLFNKTIKFNSFELKCLILILY